MSKSFCYNHSELQSKKCNLREKSLGKQRQLQTFLLVGNYVYCKRVVQYVFQSVNTKSSLSVKHDTGECFSGIQRLSKSIKTVFAT